MTRQGQQHTHLLAANITPLLPSVQGLLGGLKGLFAASGPVLADQQAYAAIFGLLQREFAMVAMDRAFQFLGILSLAMIPFLALTKRPSKGEASALEL